MDNKEKKTEEQPQQPVKTNEEPIEIELDQDNEVHKKGADFIIKESHHLDIDDEVKKG